MSTITTERLTKIISETQAVISECNARGVHGSVEVNARLFENMLMELLRHRAAMLQGTESDESRCTMKTAPALDSLPKYAKSRSSNSPEIPDAYDIEAFGVFSATEGENGLMIQVERFHFETDSCPQIRKDKFVPKFAIQAIINRLQKHCDNMEDYELIDIF